MKKLLVFLSFVFIFSWSLSKADPTFRLPIGVNLQSLDPAQAEDFVTIRVLMNLGTGLVRLNKKLKAVPALAQSWKISENKKVYTFKLKKSFWSDGTQVSADDFIRGFEHTFSPTVISKIANPLLELIEGAQDYKLKNISDFKSVGIKKINQNELQIKLTHPASYFLSFLALPPCFPKFEGSPSQILPQSPTTGPYILKEIKNERITLTPNLKSEDKALNNLEFIFIKEESTALALYEKGEIDFIDKIPSSDFDRFKNNPSFLQAPWLATYYIGFNQNKPPFDSLEVRRAFVQGVNRNELVGLLREGQRVSSSWVPTPLPSSEYSYGPHFDPRDAKAHWTKYSTFKSLDFFFDNQEKNSLIATRLQKEVSQNLNVKLNLHGMEWKSYLQYLKTSSPALFRFAWLAAFPDPLSHLGIFTSTNPNNYTGYKNAKYDELIREIEVLGQSKRRDDLIQKAQQMLLTTDIVIMPLFNYVQNLLMAKNWQGLEVTPMGVLYFHRVFLKSSL